MYAFLEELSTSRVYQEMFTLSVGPRVIMSVAMRNVVEKKTGNARRP